ncbi:biopolymer transporter ExbD [Candidatus Fermentibacterales bacterium]|nr:biopolymer transporter ExbD [Candidatus Fermentibacterales bacterium]
MAQAASGRSHRKKRGTVLDMLPVMNLFCVIIPFLLLSASFLEVTTIAMSQTEGISRSGGSTANLARSEEDRLQPKVIVTEREMFLGTTAATVHVCYSFQVLDQETGRSITRYDMDSLRIKLQEAHEVLSEAYPMIEFRKVTILTEPRVRLDNFVEVVDVCREIGLDQPGLQVAPPEAFASALGGLPRGG